MSNCDSGTNSQLKALQARLDRVDDDLAAHYAGLSQIVIGLAANPLTAAAVGPVAAIYNMNASGQTLLKQLLGMLPGVKNFRNLQHIDAAGRIEGMAGNLAQQSVEIVATMAEQTALQAGQRATAIAALEAAKAQGLVGSALIPFEEEVSRLNGLISQSNAMVSRLGAFLNTLNDIADCRTRSQIIVP